MNKVNVKKNTSQTKFKKNSVACLILIGLMGLFCYFFYANLNFLLAHFISNVTKTPVLISSINFNDDVFNIKNIMIANPQKAHIPIAFRAEQLIVEAPYKNYLKKFIVINKIEIDNVYMNIEFFSENKEEGNWQLLFKNITTAHSNPKFNKRQALIKKLILNNIQVNLILPDGKIHRLSPIEHLEFDDVASEEGIPLKEISEIIAQKMVYTILKEDGLNLIIKIPLKAIKTIFPFL